jgi:hypothetical protein
MLCINLAPNIVVTILSAEACMLSRSDKQVLDLGLRDYHVDGCDKAIGKCFNRTRADIIAWDKSPLKSPCRFKVRSCTDLIEALLLRSLEESHVPFLVAMCYQRRHANIYRAKSSGITHRPSPCQLIDKREEGVAFSPLKWIRQWTDESRSS